MTALKSDKSEAASPGPGYQKAGDREFVVALAKGLRLLEAFTPEVKWLGNAALSQRSNIPKPTVSRFTKALTAMGYLHYSSSRRQYRLGVSVLALGYSGRAGSSVGEIARPYLQELADDFNVHASLLGIDQTNALHIEVCHSTRTLMTLQLEVGSRIPLAGTASGHALLSRLREPDRTVLFSEMEKRHEKRWPEVSAKIAQGLAEVDEKGYTSSRFGWQSDINGVAVPIVLAGGASVLAISCGAPSERLPPERFDVLGRRLVAVAQALAEEITRRRDADAGV